jgi:hypothetical protein
MIREHERVILAVDLPEAALQAGDVGVVVMIHGDGEGFEVEFFTVDGKTFEVVTVTASQVRPVSSGELLHARPVNSR